MNGNGPTYHTLLLFSLLVLLGEGGCGLQEPPAKSGPLPNEYSSLHMPQGWWTDQKILDEGREIYLGRKIPGVNCAQCHGQNGKPVKGSAKNFRNVSSMKENSDSYLMWRIAEGVPYSAMGAFKDKLSQEEIWKVIAFVTTLGMDGMQYDPETKSWVSSGRES